MPLKAAIYDPYLDTLGGGERYCLTLAEALLTRGFQVDIFWSGSPKILDLAQSRFGLTLSGINIVPDIFSAVPPDLDSLEEQGCLVRLKNTCLVPRPHLTKKIFHFFDKYRLTHNYDLFFYLGDGSLPYIFSKNNFIHIQVPLIQHPTLLGKLNLRAKQFLVKKIICNSAFTKKIVSSYLNREKILVIYPPVDVDNLNAGEKRSTILSVGRFDNILNVKKQDLLIESFIALQKSYPKSSNWELILAGGSQQLPQDNHYLQLLKHQAKNHPIKFFVNPDFTTLKQLYSTASIYWHAAGYQIDENTNPQQTEHFGITVVEAQASGAVPIVVAKGGLPEIVVDGQNGFLWQTPTELVQKTIQLIDQPKLCQQLSKTCQKSAQKYSKNNFIDSFFSLI